MTQYNPGSNHPEEYRQDLNPEARAGENHGLAGNDQRTDRLTLADIKDAHEHLRGFSPEELRRVPILREGTRLEQGATYIDVAGDRIEFKATAEMKAEHGRWLAPKHDVEYPLWNRLIGVREPERTAADPARGPQR